MKMLRLFMMFLLASSLLFTACDETDPDNDSKETEVVTTLQALDAQMAGMGDLQQSPAMMAALQMPEGLMDFELMLPKLIETVGPANLSKNSTNGRVFETLADSTIDDILAMLDSLYGTHTYTGTQWVHDDMPTNQIIIIFPFINLETNSAHMAEIKFHSIVVSETNLGGDFELSADGVRYLWVTLSLAGSDLLGENAVPSSVNISGGMLADNGITVNFGLQMTDSGASFEIGVAGLPSMTLTIEADNMFEAMDSEEGPVPTSIGFGYGSVELVINNFEPTSLGEDMGDVFYNNTKVGDIVVEENGIFIVFNNGNRRDISDLMPNMIAMLEGLPA